MPSGGSNKGKGKCAAWVRAHAGHTGSDCLIWPYARLIDGYGQFGHLGRMWRAHVMMCELAHGPSPGPGFEVAHNCLNGHGGCVNPRHLEWKTRVDNQNDRYRHGQRISKRGKPRVKLTLAQAQEIRRLKGQMTQQELADRFGVSRTNIIMIQNGQTWSDRPVRRILTADQVRKIRASDIPAAELAAEFGMTAGSIYRIQKGDFYKYVEGSALSSAYGSSED